MIAKTFTDSFIEVQKLIKVFQTNQAHYLSPKYQEAEVRQEFLDKFFVALGWDVYHHENSNPYEREVKIEKSVMVQGRGKRADYAFYTAPNFAQARFMAEAKKPSRQLENPQDCFQAIRYGWNSNTPISVLTDFEQFLVLDSRYKPTIETAAQRIIKEKSFTYTDFADEEKFKEIYYLFSREAVANNSLETFAKGLKGGRGARQSKLFNTSIIQPMDEEFLSELDEQRVVLAKAFKNRNPELDGETLTEITQRTLDRLVFLRFLEDKLVEPDSVIDNLGKRSGSAWRDFIGEMPRLNQTYNGTLFKTHTLLDNPNFAPDERAFEQTRDWLAHVNSPYDFNSIPIHILGSIYERFLGKTIVTTDKRATVEDKPEVRKAGGVYYTPEYIVRYIVENTIGKLIEKKKPEEIAEMRFADIACGSGSFLLGVFDYLIAYHVEYFSENKTRRDKAIKDGLCRETIEGTLQLTIHYKREILTNNIYGVDLDAQAVEVAQLSLYLKLLEEETTATKQQFLAGFREQLLPSLKDNIVHGNSLIDYDIMDGMLFDTRELKQLNPMNFQSTFPEVFQKGGFDAIVGNPPYVRPHNIPKHIKEILWAKYSTFVAKSDLYSVFMERGLSLVKFGGLFSFIIPQTWTSLESFTKIRHYILLNALIIKLVQLPKKVFSDATVETCIFIFNRIDKELEKRKNKIQVEKIELDKNYSVREFSQSEIEDAYIYNFQLYGKNSSKELIEKIQKRGQSLENFTDFVYGFKTGDDEKFIHGKPLYKESTLFIRSADVTRYFHSKPTEYVWYVPEQMTKNRKTARPGSLERFEANKIIVARMGKKVVATYSSANLFVKDAMLLLNKNTGHSMLYLLAVINSRLINFFYKEFFITIDVLKNALLSLPIRAIDFSKPKEKSAHDKMVELVEKMLEAKKSQANAQTDKDKTFFERYCDSLDKQIDALVYDLYALSADEKRIIESS